MSHNDGSYTWTIDDEELLDKIVNAENGEQFVSEIFEIGEISWRMDIRPNGMNEENIGSFLIFLKLIQFPSSWNNITICRMIESPQTKSSVIKMARYGDGDSFGWKANILLLNDIKTSYKLYNKLIFIINIKMIHIELKNDLFYHIEFNYYKKQELKWKLDSETLNILKRSNNGKCSSSNIFDEMWVIEIYPNGDDKRDKGKFNIGLRLCALPKNVSKLYIKWTISIKEFNFKQSLKGEYTLMNPCKIVTAGLYQEFRKCNNLEIKMDILIIRSERIEHLSRMNIKYIDDNNYNEESKMAVQFEIYQHSINQQIESLKEEFTVKAQEIEEKLMNNNNNNDDDDDDDDDEKEIDDISIDDELCLYQKQIISLKRDLNAKTQEIQKLLDANQENQQQIESLMNVNKNKEQEIKIINDKLKHILNEEDDDDMMIEINKLKEEIKRMSDNKQKPKMGLMNWSLLDWIF